MEIHNPTDCTFIETQIVEQQIVQQQTVQQQIVSSHPEQTAQLTHDFDINAITDAELDWLKPTLGLAEKRQVILDMREHLLAQTERTGSTERKKGIIFYAVFRHRYQSKQIQHMPTYPQAQQLFGDLPCFPTSLSTYSAACHKICPEAYRKE